MGLVLESVDGVLIVDFCFIVEFGGDFCGLCEVVLKARGGVV